MPQAINVDPVAADVDELTRHGMAAIAGFGDVLVDEPCDREQSEKNEQASDDDAEP